MMRRTRRVARAPALLVLALLGLSMHANSHFAQGQASEVQQQQQQQQQQDQRSAPTGGQDEDAPRPSNSSAKETLETAPTITSVHQVWTSSSSGRLDELSPEVISKLRNDVPFLAAYALRPRLVGAAAAAAHLRDEATGDARLEIAASNEREPSVAPGGVQAAAARQLDARSRSSAALPKDFDEYKETSSSLSKSEHHHKRTTSVKRARPTGGGNGGQAGALESSSSSLRRRRVSSRSPSRVHKEPKADSLGQLVKTLRQGREAPSGSGSSSSSGRALRTAKAGGRQSRSSRGRSTGRASRRRRRRRRSKSSTRNKNSEKLNARASRLKRAGKSGRLFQEGGPEVASKTNEIGGGGGGGGGVKGGEGDSKGGSPRMKKTPFYASTRPVNRAAAGEKDDEPEVGGVGRSGGGGGGVSTGPSTGPSAIDENKLDDDDNNNNNNENSDIDEEEQEEEPKRVGDGDVEEDIGDTVLVEPKSDGVDDDPPLPDSLPDDDAGDDASDDAGDDPRDVAKEDVPEGGVAGAGTGAGAGSGNRVGAGGREQEEGPKASGTPRLAPEGDPRGNRVNREKPNEPPPLSPARDDDANEEPEGGGQVAGGGIGATTLGGGGGATGSSGSGRGGPDEGATREEEEEEATDRETGRGGSRDGSKTTSPGIEFASGRDDEGEDEDDDGDRERGARPPGGDKGQEPADELPPTGGARDKPSGAGAGAGATGGGSSSGPGNSDGQFGDRRRAPGDDGGRGGVAGGSKDFDNNNDDDDDDDDDDLDYRDEMATGAERGRGPKDARPRDGAAKPAADGGNKSPASAGDGESHKAAGAPMPTHGHHCDDGSYDHGHHHHHDTIDWLRGAIPGEPDDDYPILSRVNGTNFKCADQKHPGYYADVDARCQIFHICQADGRQDSFLCPNGTIFSQRTLVCVWWNGFDCEDAPKYYHLNELLYKTPNGNEGPQAAALPSAANGGGGGGGALRPLMTPLRPMAMWSRDGGRAHAPSGAAPDDGDEASPIDGLVRAMRARNEPAPRDAGGAAENSPGANRAVTRGAGAAGNGRSDLGPEVEATIQRKSTNLDDDSAADDDDEPPARLRARDHVPRRRRRASTRQAPPKLKSRRVSRNSRRRKLRHGIKPRRRA